MDELQIGRLYEQHAPAVHGYLARRVGRQDAGDLLAEVFVAALTARARFQPHASASHLPWLYGIAGNVVRQHLRTRRPGSLIEAPEREDTTVDWDAVDDRLDATARRGSLRTALAALSPTDRELLLLVAWEGLNPAQAAESLGITPQAARTRLHRARSRAQQQLDELEPSHVS